METIFINMKIVRQMSLTNLFISLLTNFILRLQMTKILDWLIPVFTTRGKTSSHNTTTINLNDELE